VRKGGKGKGRRHGARHGAKYMGGFNDTRSRTRKMAGTSQDTEGQKIKSNTGYAPPQTSNQPNNCEAEVPTGADGGQGGGEKDRKGKKVQLPPAIQTQRLDSGRKGEKTGPVAIIPRRGVPASPWEGKGTADHHPKGNREQEVARAIKAVVVRLRSRARGAEEDKRNLGPTKSMHKEERDRGGGLTRNKDLTRCVADIPPTGERQRDTAPGRERREMQG